MSRHIMFGVVIIFMMVAAVSVVWAEDEQSFTLTCPTIPVEDTPQTFSPTGTQPEVQPQPEMQTPVEETPQEISEPAPSQPPVIIREIREGPKVVTKVIVRERGRTKVIYSGKRLSREQVYGLIAEWAKTADVASRSFVAQRDQYVWDMTQREFGKTQKQIASLKSDLEKTKKQLRQRPTAATVVESGQHTHLGLVLWCVALTLGALWLFGKIRKHDLKIKQLFEDFGLRTFCKAYNLTQTAPGKRQWEKISEVLDVNPGHEYRILRWFQNVLPYGKTFYLKEVNPYKTFGGEFDENSGFIRTCSDDAALSPEELNELFCDGLRKRIPKRDTVYIMYTVKIPDAEILDVNLDEEVPDAPPPPA